MPVSAIGVYPQSCKLSALCFSAPITSEKGPYKHTAVESATPAVVFVPDSSEGKFVMTFSLDKSDI